MDVNKQNTSISYKCKQTKYSRYPTLNVNKQNTSISYINVNKTKHIDILQKCKQNKTHRYPT